MKRHHKDGVRIAVGRVGICRIVSLPGPHAEVCLGSRALIEGLEAGLDDAALAESIASVIRERWLNHMGRRRCAWTIARPLQSNSTRPKRAQPRLIPLTVTYPGLTVEQAYAIQLEGVAIRRERDSRKVVGKKIGLDLNRYAEADRCR